MSAYSVECDNPAFSAAKNFTDAATDGSMTKIRSDQLVVNFCTNWLQSQTRAFYLRFSKPIGVILLSGGNGDGARIDVG